jgi:Tol biopolymer transport system component
MEDLVRTLPALAVALCFAAGPAHAAYFGKNKVQYKTFHWQVLETPHFEILFYDREAAVVQDAARLAERAYAQLSATLQHEFTRRIPLVLYASHADFQQTNITESFIDLGTGGVTDLLRRRVFLPFTGSYAELEHVLTHELVHAFELDILYDPSRGDAMSPFAYAAPLWIMEGLAEYLSRGAADAHTAMWVRDACLAGTLPTVQQMEYVGDIRVYRFGQSIWQFFAEEYGNDKIGDLLRALRDTRSLDKALKNVANVSLAEFSERWGMTMRRRHLPGIAAHRTAREFAEPVVTRRTERAGLLLAASVSPDGDRVAYVSDARLTHSLCVRPIEAEGKVKPRHLIQSGQSGDLEALRFFSAGAAWSPDGTMLAVPVKAGGEDALTLIDVESGDVTAQLAFGLDEVQTATFSPDGQEIIFVGLSEGQSDLYRVRRDGTELRRLTQDRHAERDPQWSPDGRFLAYVGDAGPDTDFEALRFGRMRLLVRDLESGATRDVTPFAGGKAVSPVWSGDGEYLAFLSDRDGISNIYVTHLPTGNVFRVTATATGISGILPTSPALSWAQSRDRLVFSSFSESGFDIYRIDDVLKKLEPLDLEPGTMIALATAPADPMHATDATLGMTPPDSTRHAAADTIAMSAAADTSSFTVRGYKVRLSPDLANVGGLVGYEAGFGGQSQIHFSDLLGNHNLAVGVGIYGSLKDSDLYVSYLNRSRRTNYALAGFQFRKRYGLVGSLSSLDTEHQTYRGVQATALRPFDKFTRLEASVQLASVSGRFFLGQTAAEAEADPSVEEMRTFVGPGVAYVFDSSLWGYTGPIKGRRLRLSADGALGQIRYGTFEADARQYWHLGRTYALAGRLYGATSHGSTPQTFYLGGSQTLRGYDYGSLVGNHALLASLEFRFPLVRHLALGWPLPLEFGNVQGVLFADAGTAWDGDAFTTSRSVRDEPVGRAPQAALGFGARIGLGYLVLKLDWAQRYDTGTGIRSPGSTVSLGTDF